jgi:nicotinate-nucleotide adenylyltransferase
VQEHYHFDEVIFVPCKSPVLDKTCDVSIKDRLAMLSLALRPFTHFKIDLCEINRDTPSFMVTTLAYFRQHYGDHVSLTLLIGMDNFLQLPRWYQWETILQRCHMLVVDRPGVKPVFNRVLKTLLSTHQSTSEHHLSNSPYGTITFMHAGAFDISSTAIRSVIKQMIRSSSNTDKLISPQVRNYIERHKLF